MEGDLGHAQTHDFLADDMVFDDLMNPGSWSNPPPVNHQYTTSYQQQNHPPPQNTYPQYLTSTNQPNYQFDLSRQSYSPVPYSNSPYSSQPPPQSQPLPQQQSHSPYQQLSRPSNEHNSPYGPIDPSLHSSNLYQSPSNSFLYPQQQTTHHPSVSPNSLYANPVSQLQQVSRPAPNSPYQLQANQPISSFNHGSQQNANSYYHTFQQENITPAQTSSVHYPSLQNGKANEVQVPPSRNFDIVIKPNPQLSQAIHPPPKTVPLVPTPTPPATSVARITHPELLALRDTTLKHPMNHAPYVVFKNVAGASLPTADAKVTKVRKSRVVTDGKASLVKPPAKRGRPRKEKTATTTGYQGTGRPPKAKPAKVQGDHGSVRKSASPSETSSSEEDSSSEDESEYEDESAMPAVDISTVRDTVRPTDPALAARWDTIGIVWKDPHQNPNQEVVSEAVSKYGQFVMAFRNQIKVVTTKIEEAAIKPEELPKLKQDQAGLLEALYQSIHATVTLGAPVIVDQLGNHHQLVNALISTLRDCIKTSDYNGKLPKETLSLLAKFKTLTDDILKKCKFDSVQKRWVKKGDKDNIQKFAEILANTVEAQEKTVKTKELNGDKKAREAFEQAKQRNAEIKAAGVTGTATATKRPAEGDPSNGKPAKKFASDASGNTAPVTKTTIVKKPTSNLLGIATRPVAKPVVKKREPSPPQESKLGALLASIAKPAEVPKAPSAPPRAPETPEEKARRERKESRRHLRVKFKEGSELEQVRLFKHEQEEDEGRQDDMLRDAADTHNEGMMHKRRATETIDLDDDDYQPPDVVEPEFAPPKDVDFSPLEKITKYGPTFRTRGGDLQISTPEQQTQKRREAVELLVIYTDPEEIPPSAKEPSHLEEFSPTPGRLPDLKQPSTPWLTNRLQNLEQYGPEQAFGSFTPTQNLNAQETQAQVMDMSKAGPLKVLFDAVDFLKGKPFPATEPPEWMTQFELRARWLEGYNKDKDANDRRQAEAQMAAQVQAQHVPPPIQTQQLLVPPPPPSVDHSLLGLLPQQFPPPPLPTSNPIPLPFLGYGNEPPVVPPPFDYHAWASTGIASNDQNSAFDGIHPSRREEVERSRRDEDSRHQSKPKKKSKNWDNFDANGEYKGPKQPCKFYNLNQCKKGADCTYSHDM